MFPVLSRHISAGILHKAHGLFFCSYYRYEMPHTL
jgi:hypothetical protein